ncbi:hypothetical protein [Niveibacterium sp. SC-1]|uniref:hypothetical protein n=1 Tax=Niveibacterium sp. SC-1 TaxID=3135646 RepID=UPI00311DEB95
MFPDAGNAPSSDSVLFRALCVSVLLHVTLLWPSQFASRSFLLGGERRMPLRAALQSNEAGHVPGHGRAAPQAPAMVERLPVVSPRTSPPSVVVAAPVHVDAPTQIRGHADEERATLTPLQGRAMRAYQMRLAQQIALALPADLPSFEATVRVQYAPNGALRGVDPVVEGVGVAGARDWLISAFSAAAIAVSLPGELNGRVSAIDVPVIWQPAGESQEAD